MGQRLNIEITDGEKTIAACLYQYGATTEIALDLTNQVIQSYTRWFARSGTDRYIVLRVLEHTGAGINGSERRRIRESSDDDLVCTEFMPARGLSYGMIFITKAGISEARKWEDARVTINLKQQTFCFGVFYYTLAEDYFADEGWFQEMEKLPLMEADGSIFNKLRFDQIDTLEQVVAGSPDGLRLQNGDVIEWIR